jgi:co-chaperonin GroES (HSP10)
MQAAGEYLLLKLPPPKIKSDGGLELPQDSKQKFYYGRVLSMGTDAGAKLEMDNIAVGEHVLFDLDGSVTVHLDPMKGDSVIVVHQTQVYAMVSEEELAQKKLPVVDAA